MKINIDLSKFNKTNIMLGLGIVLLLFGIFYPFGPKETSDQTPTFDTVSDEDKSIETGEEPQNNNTFGGTISKIRYNAEELAKSSNEVVIRYPDSGNYQILVTGSPFESARQKAEQQFMEQTGFTVEEACAKNVIVNTPSYANPKEAGINYSLSFCTPSYLESLSEGLNLEDNPDGVVIP